MLSKKQLQKYETLSDKYKFLDLLPLEHYFTYRIIKENYFNSKFQTKTNTRTRHGHLRTVQRTYNKHGDRLDNVLIPKFLNSLPKEFTNLTQIGKIKRLVKNWLLEKDIN